VKMFRRLRDGSRVCGSNGKALHVKLWTAEARASYERALALTQQEPERQFLQERIRQLK
jgi:predicted RNA polymerase sigma factor